MEELSYTFQDLIVDPKLASKYIGKVVYFSDSPIECLNLAIHEDPVNRDVLKAIEYDQNFPFLMEEHDTYYACIVPKKDLSPKYVEFKNLDEFSKAYDESCKHVKSDSIGGRLIKAGGVWLIREKTKTNSFYQVGYLYDNGLKVLGWGDVDWEDLFRTFTFLDKSPCGKKI